MEKYDIHKGDVYSVFARSALTFGGPQIELSVCLCVCTFFVRFMLAGGRRLHMPPSSGVLIWPHFRNPEKSAHKLALRGESSTFEDPFLDHFLDTSFLNIFQKVALRATRSRAVV